MSNIKKYSLFVVIGAFFLLEFIYYGHQYFFHAGSFEEHWRNTNSKSLAIYLREVKQKYPRIIVPTTPWTPIYYLFFSKDFDKKYVGQFMNDFKILIIDNVEFKDMDCPSSMAPSPQDDKERIAQFKNVLLVDNGTCKILSWLNIVDEIKNSDGNVAFRVLALK